MPARARGRAAFSRPLRRGVACVCGRRRFAVSRGVKKLFVAAAPINWSEDELASLRRLFQLRRRAAAAASRMGREYELQGLAAIRTHPIIRRLIDAAPDLLKRLRGPSDEPALWEALAAALVPQDDARARTAALRGEKVPRQPIDYLVERFLPLGLATGPLVEQAAAAVGIVAELRTCQRAVRRVQAAAKLRQRKAASR